MKPVHLKALICTVAISFVSVAHQYANMRNDKQSMSVTYNVRYCSIDDTTKIIAFFIVHLIYFNLTNNYAFHYF